MGVLLKNFSTPKFSLKVFYKIGMVCFGVVAISQTATLVLNFSHYNFFGVTIAIAQNIFSYVLTYFFFWLYKTNTSTETSASDEDITAAFEEAAKKQEALK